MKKKIIANGLVVTMNTNRDILRGDVLIEGRHIRKVGQLCAEDRRHASVIDASDRVVSPGFVQTHVHLCQTLFRNLADDLELLDWLRLKIWPYEAAHTPSSIALSAQMGLLELIRCGTTTLMDMGTVRHTDHIFRQIEKSGLRAFCGKAMMDAASGAPKGLRETDRWSIEESLRLRNTWDGRADGRLHFAFAPRFVLSCSEKLLHEVRDLSDRHRTIVHTHAAENRSELEEVRRRHGMNNIEYFHSIRLTGERLCLAHCIWIDEREMAILRETSTNVLHCPSSNLKLGSGIARVPEMMKGGLCVSLGADGAPCNNNLDIFQEMRLAALIQKPTAGVGAMPPRAVYEMATINGARALGLQQEIGSIEPGKKADLIIMDLQDVRSMPWDDVYAAVVYSAHSSCVQTVLVDGQVVMKNREVKTLDEESIRTKIPGEIRRLLRRT